MSVLLREDILGLLNRDSVAERLIVTPMLDDEQVGPGSIDLRLGTEFIEALRRAGAVVDPLDDPDPPSEDREESVFIPLGEHFVLHPGQFVLGGTLEYVRLPADVMGQVLSRSSWGRLGLLVATAVIVHPGFSGTLTLELVNTGSVPIRLYPGLRVAQLQLWSSADKTELPYGRDEAKYLTPLGPEGNRLAWESDELERIRAVGAELAGRE